MSLRKIAAILFVLAALSVGGVTLSGADFSTGTANPVNAFAAADDLTPPSATLSDPGSPLRGSVTLSATASDAGSGVASVTVQRSAAGQGSWSEVCTDTSAPYSCPLDTTALADGLYDLRAVAVDAAGNAATSAVVGSRRVDNTAPSAVDVQSANGGTTAGKAEAKDTLVLTYSETMAAGSILAGWGGASTSVTVRMLNGAGGKDSLQVWNAANTTQLALTASPHVDLGGDYVATAGATFNATMVPQGAAITVTLGSLTGGGVNNKAAAAGTVRWTPSPSATDLAGNPCAGDAASESGSADAEF